MTTILTLPFYIYLTYLAFFYNFTLALTYYFDLQLWLYTLIITLTFCLDILWFFMLLFFLNFLLWYPTSMTLTSTFTLHFNFYFDFLFRLSTLTQPWHFTLDTTLTSLPKSPIIYVDIPHSHSFYSSLTSTLNLPSPLYSDLLSLSPLTLLYDLLLI